MNWINELIHKLTKWAYDCDGMCGFYNICKQCHYKPIKRTNTRIINVHPELADKIKNLKK